MNLCADMEQEIRQAAKFAQYGLAATEEALRDAGFEGGKGIDGEMTVSMALSTCLLKAWFELMNVGCRVSALVQGLVAWKIYMILRLPTGRT